MPQRAGGREGDWICANCGAVHKSNDQPCRECAGERFARLEAESTPNIDSSISVTYRCKECGTTQPTNSTPCNGCGNLTFETISDVGTGSGDAVGQLEDSTDDSWNWLNPPGPFQTLRRYVGYFTIAAFVLPLMFIILGLGPGFWFLMLVFGWPWLLVGLGVLWIVDNVIGYLRHG